MTLPRVLCGLTAAAALAAPAVAHAAYFDVAKLPPPVVQGKEMADNDASFSSTYQGRYTGTPIEKQAGAFLLDEFKSLGYDAKEEDFSASTSAPDPSGTLHAITATRKGLTHPDQYIVMEGHYDISPGATGLTPTVQGSYDNGSGTQMVRALAKSFAKIPTNKTIVFALYNGEEEGTLASGPHAQSFVDKKLNVTGVLGFDMVGIAWPVAMPGATNCLCMWYGDEDDAFDPLLKHVNFDVLKYPEGDQLVQVVGANTRNSDEASWDSRKFPTMRWAGLRTAANYPAYHLPNDNMDEIDTVAGGRTYFEQGLRNTLFSAYDTALTLDNSQPEAALAASGSGPVTFDATGSKDADGPPSSYVWDFGDGTSASGTTVSHSYAKPGTYTAKLTVGDNMWPSVTATKTATVNVTAGAGVAKTVVKKSKRAACVKKAKKIKNKRKRAKALKRCKKIKG